MAPAGGNAARLCRVPRWCQQLLRRWGHPASPRLLPLCRQRWGRAGVPVPWGTPSSSPTATSRLSLSHSATAAVLPRSGFCSCIFWFLSFGSNVLMLLHATHPAQRGKSVLQLLPPLTGQEALSRPRRQARRSLRPHTRCCSAHPAPPCEPQLCSAHPTSLCVPRSAPCTSALL